MTRASVTLIAVTALSWLLSAGSASAAPPQITDFASCLLNGAVELDDGISDAATVGKVVRRICRGKYGPALEDVYIAPGASEQIAKRDREVAHEEIVATSAVLAARHAKLKKP